MDLIEQIWQGSGLYQLTFGQFAMIGVGLGLLYLAIVRKFEPLLLVTIGFGGVLSNIPGAEIATGDGLLHLTYVVGIESGAFPLIIFMGVGALTDFGPLLANPKTLFLGAAAQFGIFATLLGALGLTELGVMDFSVREAAAIGIIGGADGPTAIYVAGNRSTTPHSRIKFPKQNMPSKGAADGNSSATSNKSTNGNMMRSVCETVRSWIISIDRSFCVVSNFMMGG